MKRMEYLAAAAVVILAAGWSNAARAHELSCEAAVNDTHVFAVKQYPVTLDYSFTVKNEDRAQASKALKAEASVLGSLGYAFSPAPPFVLEKGASVKDTFSVTLNSRAECLQLAGKDGRADSHLDVVFRTSWDLGEAHCRARVLCEEPREDDCPKKDTRICGKVEAFQAATLTQKGFIIIDGVKHLIAAGTKLVGEETIQVGLELCLEVHARVELDASLTIEEGTVKVDADVLTELDVCGTVEAFQAATLTQSGYIVLSGVRYLIAAGTQLLGQEAIQVGVNLCLQARALVNVDAAINIHEGRVDLDVGAITSVDLCGTVEAFQAATLTQSGYIVLDGVKHLLAAGVSLVGQEAIQVGVNLCLQARALVGATASVNILEGRVLLDADADGRVKVCGEVSLFVAATALTDGLLTIDGRTFTIAAGVTLEGQALLVAGARVCLEVELKADVLGVVRIAAGKVAAHD
jgi:hypothetical protein